jgi:hypothetical protein
MARRNAGGGKAVGLLKDGRVLAQVDPGQKLEEPGRWRGAARHQHRDRWKRRLPCLAHYGEFALVLLGVADPMLTDKDDERPMASSRAGTHGRPGRSLLRSKKVEKPWSLQPIVQLRRGSLVAAVIAGEHIEDIAASPCG